MKLCILILITVASFAFGQTEDNNIANNVTEKLPTNITLTTTSPLEIVCKQTTSCQQYDNIKQPKYNDLRTRKCMCDEKCSLYGDCCLDSIHFKSTGRQNVSFGCKNTFFDGYVYMVDKCASNYSHSAIIENCETTNRTHLLYNFLLTIPVTNTLTNITYKNGFCAICNNEMKFEFWETVVHFEIEKSNLDIIVKNSSTPALSNSNFYSVVDRNSILSQIKVNETRSELISSVKGLTYLCNVVANIPNNIAPAVRFCLSDSKDRVCSECEKEKGISAGSCIENSNPDLGSLIMLPLNDPRLPKMDFCNVIPDAVVNKNVFCQAAKSEPKVKSSAEPDIENCFFMDNKGKLCLVSEFYGPDECKITENGSLYVNKFHYAFPPHEYTNDTTDKNLIYVCGTEIPRSDEEKRLISFRDNLTELLIKFSIFFLTLYLVTNVNKQKLQSLPNKILFSFCVTLLALYLVFEIGQWQKSCKIAAAILHYLFLSCFIWLLVASFDFWQVICWSSTKLQTLAGKTRLKRYFIYCFIGWISPLSIMMVSIYFELAINKIVPCPLKPGYGRLNQCFISQYYPRYYFFLYPSAVIFLCIIGLFAHTSYHIYLSKRKNIKSTAQNNYYILFLKLALTMGLTWTLGLTVTYTDINFFKTAYVILNASHGTLMYFAYGFKSTMLTNMYEKHKNHTIVQQTKSTFFSITDKIKTPATQSTTSVDPPTQEMESTT